MRDFGQFMAIAQAHEDAVRDHLVEFGWTVEPFGQALLTAPCRLALRSWKDRDGKPTLVRWLPDLIAYRHSKCWSVALVDAKSEVSKHANHAVEQASVDCDRVISTSLNVPTYYVFDDFGVATPDDVVSWGHIHNGIGTKGSGTPFYLVAKSACRRFDDVFALGATS